MFFNTKEKKNLLRTKQLFSALFSGEILLYRQDLKGVPPMKEYCPLKIVQYGFKNNPVISKI
jgi:hypothetical protein